jgi:hypothetical protein
MATISMQMGRSSKRAGPTLIRLRGTPGGLQSASLTTLRLVGRSKFSKSKASRLRKYYRADGPRRLYGVQVEDRAFRFRLNAFDHYSVYLDEFAEQREAANTLEEATPQLSAH